jgi:hypothetical protein
LLAFFDSKGLTYTYIVPRGASIHTTNIIKVPGNFTKELRIKIPEMVQS